MSSPSSLVVSQNHVETPFIIVNIGKYRFGHTEKTYRDRLKTTFDITNQNYIKSLRVVKINGAINTYTLNMVYAITQDDDPNRLEKIFSSISSDRTITLMYGDWNAPQFIFKEEKALVTKLTTRLNVSSSTIEYSLQCVGTVFSASANNFYFPSRTSKPSTVLLEMLGDKKYQLEQIFQGMQNPSTKNFIVTDDCEVLLESKTCTIFEYISYLVSCMVYEGDEGKTLKTSCYFWSTYDDYKNTYGGSYFKVVRASANTDTLVSYNTYEVDVGYPTTNCVTNFTLNNDDSWSILYNYSSQEQLTTHSYYIDDNGKMVKQEAPSLLNSASSYIMTEATRNWWSKMTQFPVTATLTMKGLLRPAVLMSYVKVNTLFYGRKHTSSGLYIITKQEDSVSESGYRTTLSLTRVGGDEKYI